MGPGTDLVRAFILYIRLPIMARRFRRPSYVSPNSLCSFPLWVCTTPGSPNLTRGETPSLVMA